jgi:Fe2+ or Zn2+ uptake regulation protein
MGRRVHPTSVYRSLRCLVEAGLILPVVTWKKFLIAPDPGGGLWALLLCRACRSCTPVAFSDECPELSQRLSRRGFVRRTCSAEAEGLCRGCTGPAVDSSG